MNSIEKAQLGISSATGAAGTALSFIPRVGTAVGMGVAGVGSLINGILGLADVPEAPKVPAGQRQAAGIGAQALAGLVSESGVNAQQVGFIGQAGRDRQVSESLAANTLAASLSPYDRKRIFDRLMQTSVDVSASIADTIQRIDPLADADRYAKIIQGSAVVGGQQAQIAQQETIGQAITQNYRKNAMAATASAMANIAKNIGAITNPENAQAENELKALGMENPTNNQTAAYADVLANQSGGMGIPDIVHDTRNDLLANAEKNITAPKGKLTAEHLSASMKDAIGPDYDKFLEYTKNQIKETYDMQGMALPSDAYLSAMAEQSLQKQYIAHIQNSSVSFY